jgi:raffinose/stachyose/melibiose transport system permease protein
MGNRSPGLLFAYVVLVFGAALALFPLALMALNALKSSIQITTSPLSLPHGVRWDNFTHAWVDAQLGRALLNSAQVTATTIIVVCATGSMAAFALARRQVRGWRLISVYFLASTTLPIQLFLFPLYFAFARLGLIDNVFAVSMIYTAVYSPFSIFLLRTYFLAIPAEVQEAAIIDGATRWQTFSKVMLPIVSPGIITVAVITGLNTWNEFLIAYTFLQDKTAQTAIVRFYLLGGQYSSDWGEIMAAALIVVVPVLVFFVLMQRRFIEGMAGGAVKA